MRILTLEGYYNGSHRAFIDGLAAHSKHDYTLLTAPGHSWKWRMRHTSVTFAQHLSSMLTDNPSLKFDAIFCSDMTNLAEFKGLCPQIAALPAVAYFHENQAEYPNRVADQRDIHFILSNMTTALAADAVWFNSAWNRNSFLAGLEKTLSKLPQPKLKESLKIIAAKSSIQPPAIDVPDTVLAKAATIAQPVKIAWACRWEHDKRPDVLFDALRILQQNNIDFCISILGESFKDIPACFDRAKQDFETHIDHWGYAQSKADYYDILAGCDVAVSTAEHEFFGLSMLEAAAQGTAVLTPNALSYPEIFGDLAIYHDNTPASLAAKLAAVASGKISRPDSNTLHTLAKTKYSWEVRTKCFDENFETLKK